MTASGTATAAIVLLAAMWTTPLGAGEGPVLAEDLVALSLAALQEGLEAGKINPELPLPLTSILGVFLEEDGRDIVLLGRRERPAPGVVPILPDDVVVAMQATWLSDQVPGMSIDPPDDSTAGAPPAFQKVVYFGRLEDTRAGLFAFRCDYWMKRLAAGAIPAPVPGFARYSDLLMDARADASLGNRFWFHPKLPTIWLSPEGDLMLLEDAGVELLTERGYSRFARERTHHLYLGRDPVAQHFAEAFTSRYEELAASFPDLTRLRNFFALAQVFGWVERTGLPMGRVRLNKWEYLLHRYTPVPTHCPRRAPTVNTWLVRGSQVRGLSGGVSVAVRLPQSPSVDATGTLARLGSELARGQPRHDAPAWAVELPPRESQALRRLRHELAAGRSLGWLRRHAGELEGVLGIEPLAGGRVAVLHRSQEGLELTAVAREEVTTLAVGTAAAAGFDEIARATCRSASDEHVSFIHVRRTGGALIFQVGEEQARISVPEVSAFLEGRGAGSPLERILLASAKELGLYRDGIAVARPPSLQGKSPPLDDPQLWTVALQRHFGGLLRFHITDNPERARRNIRNASTVVAPSEVVVLLRPNAGGDYPVSEDIVRSLRRAGMRVARSPAEVRAARRLLFVSRGTQETLLSDLESLGRRGALQGALLILYAPHAAISLNHTQDLMERFGLLGVAHYLRDIEPALLEGALREIDGVLRDAAIQGARTTGDRLLGEAARRAARDVGTGSVWSRELSKIQEVILQV